MKYFISESFGVDLGKYREFICKDTDQHERKMFPIILDDIMFYCEGQHKETHKKIREIFKNSIVYEITINKDIDAGGSSYLDILYDIIRKNTRKYDVVYEFISVDESRRDIKFNEKKYINTSTKKDMETLQNICDGNLYIFSSNSKGKETAINKFAVNEKNEKDTYLLSAYTYRNKIFLDVVSTLGNKAADFKNAESQMIKEITRRDSLINEINSEKYNTFKSIEKIIINDVEITQRSAKYYYFFNDHSNLSNDLRIEVFYEYYFKKGSMPAELKENNIIIQRIEIETGKENKIELPLRKLQIKFEDLNQSFMIEKPLALNIKEYPLDTKIDYIDPQTCEKKFIYIDSLAFINFYEEYKDNEDILKSICNIYKKGEGLLYLLYETEDKNITCNFYLKHELEKKINYSNSGAIGIIISDKEEKENKRNGFNKKYAVVSQSVEKMDGDILIELFSIVKTTKRDEIYEVDLNS